MSRAGDGISEFLVRRQAVEVAPRESAEVIVHVQSRGTDVAWAALVASLMATGAAGCAATFSALMVCLLVPITGWFPSSHRSSSAGRWWPAWSG